MTRAMIISGGSVVDPDGDVAIQDLFTSGDRIAAHAPTDAETIDAKGLHVAPGIVDLGVFAVDKPAFIAGGITRVALMPDGARPLDDPGPVQRAALAAKPDLWVHPLGAATRGLGGAELAEYALMARSGAKAIATGREWIGDSGVMLRVLTYAASLELSVITHGEDGAITRGAVATSGETATRLGLASAPADAEAIAMARDIALAEIAGARLHFRQVTTAKGFDLIRTARARGLPVTCGITPAHLFLSDNSISDFRTFARLSPPLRSESDRLAAIGAVRDGTIDVLCSAHDPCGPESKRLPFADAAPGMAGAETLLALSLGLVRDGIITLPRLFAMLTRNPARILGVDGGTIGAGAPADLVIFDLERSWIINGSTFAAAADNTPFDRMPTQGRVRHTIKGGRVLG